MSVIFDILSAVTKPCKSLDNIFAARRTSLYDKCFFCLRNVSVVLLPNFAGELEIIASYSKVKM